MLCHFHQPSSSVPAILKLQSAYHLIMPSRSLILFIHIPNGSSLVCILLFSYLWLKYSSRIFLFLLLCIFFVLTKTSISYNSTHNFMNKSKFLHREQKIPPTESKLSLWYHLMQEPLALSKQILDSRIFRTGIYPKYGPSPFFNSLNSALFTIVDLCLLCLLSVLSNAQPLFIYLVVVLLCQTANIQPVNKHTFL